MADSLTARFFVKCLWPILKLIVGILRLALKLLPRTSVPLDGVWYNQVGDKIALDVDGSSVTGTLQPGLLEESTFPLSGFTDPKPLPLAVQIVSLTATIFSGKDNHHMVAASAGQLVKVNGDYEIVTQWFLTRNDPDSSGAWTYMTAKGQDTWRRQPLPKKEIAGNLAKISPIHPLKSGYERARIAYEAQQ